MDASFNGRRRVVITGLGIVSPLGNDVESSWRALVAGECGAGEITQFDHSNYNVHFACELKDFDPTNWIDRKAARRMDRFAQMILAAARQAQEDAGIDIAADAERIGASIATGIGGLRSYQECYDVLIQRGPDRVSPFSIPSIIPNMGAGWVSIELGTKGPLMSECTACAASNMAIGDAAVGERHLHRARGIRTRRVGLGHVRGVRRHAVADELRVDLGAARLRPLERLQHEHGTRLSHHEPVALVVERS